MPWPRNEYISCTYLAIPRRGRFVLICCCTACLAFCRRLEPKTTATREDHDIFTRKQTILCLSIFALMTQILPLPSGSIYLGRDAAPDGLQAARGGHACGCQPRGMGDGAGARGEGGGDVSPGIACIQRPARCDLPSSKYNLSYTRNVGKAATQAGVYTAWLHETEHLFSQKSKA